MGRSRGRGSSIVFSIPVAQSTYVNVAIQSSHNKLYEVTSAVGVATDLMVDSNHNNNTNAHTSTLAHMHKNIQR